MTDTTVQTVSISITDGEKTLDITRELVWGWEGTPAPGIKKLLSEAVDEVVKVIDENTETEKPTFEATPSVRRVVPPASEAYTF